MTNAELQIAIDAIRNATADGSVTNVMEADIMDALKSNNIPLLGTTEGNPASGILRYSEGYRIVNEGGVFQSSIGFDSDGTYLDHSYNNEAETGYSFVSSSLNLSHCALPFENSDIIAGIEIQTRMDNELGIGFFSSDDYSNSTSGDIDLDKRIYTQRSYVENPATLINALNNCDSTQLDTIKTILGII